MATVSITDLTNAKLDTDHIADIATSLALTAVDRLGTTKKTLQGAINSIAAIDVKGAWATTTAYVVKDAVLESGTWYICIEAHTSGTFATDLAAGKWSVLQGITDANLKDYAARKLDFVSDMKAMANPQAGEIIMLKDYASGNGAGVMYFETKATTGTDDGGSVINHNTLAFRFEQIFGDAVSAKQFGAVGDGIADDTVAIQTAIDKCLATNLPLYVPSGEYKVTSNIYIASYLTVFGEGYQSHIACVGCSVMVDAGNSRNTTTYLWHWTLRDFRITRTGTSGPALQTLGVVSLGGAKKGVARFTIDNLVIDSSLGAGWYAEDTYIGTVKNIWIGGCAGHGIEFITSTGTVNGPCLNINFFGGEINGCVKGVDLEGTFGVNFYGTAIEGNQGYGLRIRNNIAKSASVNHTTLQDVYLEGNGTDTLLSDEDRSDIVIGAREGGSVKGIVISNSWFNSNVPYGVYINKGNSLKLSELTFRNHTNTAIYRDTAYSTINSGITSGVIEQCTVDAGAAVLSANTDTYFKQTIIEKYIAGSKVHTSSGILAGSHETFDITVPGVAVGAFVTVSTAYDMTGLTYSACVPATETVRITIHNNTASTQTPTATYRVLCINKDYFI